MAIPSTMTRSRSADASDPQRVLEILARQHEIVLQLRELAGQQRALIAQNRHAALVNHIDRRQSLVDELIQSQRTMPPISEFMRDQGRPLSESTRLQIRTLIDQIGAALAEIAAADEADGQSLQAGCARVRSELESLGLAQTARRAYVDRPSSSTRFTDHKG